MDVGGGDAASLPAPQGLLLCFEVRFLVMGQEQAAKGFRGDYHQEGGDRGVPPKTPARQGKPQNGGSPSFPAPDKGFGWTKSMLALLISIKWTD